MRRLPSKKNSIDGLMEDLKDAFSVIRNSANAYEKHQRAGADKLHVVLGEIFNFGEELRDRPLVDGTSQMETFVTERSGLWNKPARENPYIALTRLTFSNEISDASLSQYASVLRHAHNRHVEPSQFAIWLSEGEGIKGRYAEAIQSLGGARQSVKSKAKARRIEIAKGALRLVLSSKLIEVPEGETELFASVLVRIDANQNAVIVDVIETDEKALHPILLRHSPALPTESETLAGKPLGRLYRAIDLIAGVGIAGVRME